MAGNVADRLVGILVQAGIKRLYAVSGGCLEDMRSAVRKNGKIQWIQVRHEETGAYAAAAESQLTGRLACCGGSNGPGRMYLINGLYDAHHSGASVIAIASTMPSAGFPKETIYPNLSSWQFDGCSCFNEMTCIPQQAVEALRNGIQAAITRKGVAVVGFPDSLMSSVKTVEIPPSSYGYASQSRICPPARDLEMLALRLNKSRKITLFCGIGCRDAHEEVIRFSQMLQAPVVYTFKGKMDLQYDNPNEVGMTGLLGMSSGSGALRDADTILMLGTDFPHSVYLPENAWIAQVDVSAGHLGRRTKVDLGLHGDVKTTLNVIMPLIRRKTNRSFLRKQLEHYKEVKKDLDDSASDKGKEGEVNPEYLMALVDRFAGDDAIFTVDTGMTCIWSARYLHATGKRRLIGSFSHGSVANALPQSIGVSSAAPGRQVLAICSDSGLSMTLRDLQTVVQYKLPVKIFVFNNRSLELMKYPACQESFSGCGPDTEQPDFAEIARSMGMTAMTVRHPDEALSVFRRAFATGGPVLVDLIARPNSMGRLTKSGSWTDYSDE